MPLSKSLIKAAKTIALGLIRVDTTLDDDNDVVDDDDDYVESVFLYDDDEDADSDNDNDK